jgi:putative ABC transport system permease protein
MKEIFGLSTTVIMFVLLGMLALCLLTTIWVALRRRVIFKLGIRNIPRRKAQTILIIVGLMLSTLIMAAAMTTGDTLNYSFNKGTYDLLGHTDEIVVQSSETTDANINNAITNKIDPSALDIVRNAVADDPNVSAVAPILFELVPVFNEATQLGEPEGNLTGMTPEDVEAFGGLVSDGGGGTTNLADLKPGEVIINATAKDKLDANVGDTLTFQYNNASYSVTVAGIAKDQILSGDLGGDAPGMVMPMAHLQQLLGESDQYSAILISNVGPIRGSEKHSDAVVDKVAPALEGQNLGIYDAKQDLVEQSELISNIFVSLFIIMGLFSIAAGIMLIVLIFSMLAAERRAEMGMERAIGAQRRQLIQQFIAEGTGYALFAGLVGSALGVLVALGMSVVMGNLFGDFVDITPHVEPRSLIIAYCLGVVITFLAVVVGSWRISRLNIVSAIRDIPEVSRARRRPRVLIFGIIMIALGVLMSVSAGDSMFLFGTGMCLWPFGVMQVLRFFGVPTRPIATLAGLWIVVFWLMPEKQFRDLFGERTGDFELFFVSGIFLVAGGTIVIIQNTDILLRIVSSLGGIFKSKLPAIRTAVAYPGSARGRTGMTIAMFSLIIFSLVMMATIVANFSKAFLNDNADAGWTVRADAGISNPIANFEQTLQDNGVDTSHVDAIGQIDNPVAGSTQVRMGDEGDWNYFPVQGMDDTFISDSNLYFSQHAIGYDTDEKIIEALKSGQPVAVISAAGLSGNGGDFGGDSITDLSADDTTFEPFQLNVLNSATGTVSQVTIIGVLNTDLSILNGLFTNISVTNSIFGPDSGYISYYIKLGDTSNDGAKDFADDVESKLLMNGVQADSIHQELKDQQSQSQSFFYMIQGFMGLGLIVGIAAIGVIAFRSVVERRQQIGVLRALGFQRSLVSLSFMIETAFVVGLGILSGGGMGLLLARNLFSTDDFNQGGSKVDFTVPWPLLALMLIATITAALFMTWIPARQAARIAPAEALRYE